MHHKRARRRLNFISTKSQIKDFQREQLKKRAEEKNESDRHGHRKKDKERQDGLSNVGFLSFLYSHTKESCIKISLTGKFAGNETKTWQKHLQNNLTTDKHTERRLSKVAKSSLSDHTVKMINGVHDRPQFSSSATPFF